MSHLGTFRKRHISKKLEKVIANMPDLEYEGGRIKCISCDSYLTCTSRWKCERHLKSIKHCAAIRGKRYSEQSTFDIGVSFILCNLPFTLLEQEAFVSFWSKYSDYTLPSRTSVRNVLPSARDHVERRIKAELKGKKLWICVNETTDRQKNSVVNVMVRTMEEFEPSSSILLASKRLAKCTSDEILKVVLSALNKFEVSKNQLLMFMSDGAANMLSLGRSLKEHSGNLLHVTCKIHTLNLVVQLISKCYPRVNALIAHTKAVFLKSSKRKKALHELCPKVPEPPQPISTCWGTWLEAAFYYCEHFDDIKKVVLQFDPRHAEAIKKGQKIFQDSQVKSDLETIRKNYYGLAEGIEKLQDVSLSFVDSVQILDDVHSHLRAAEGKNNECILRKFESGIDKDLDFLILRQICEGASKHPLSCHKDYFKFANITSLDVERSFSSLKNIYSARRTHLTETSVETYLMIQIFNRCQPVCDFMEVS